MTFEDRIRRIQQEAGWSDHTLLGTILDYFWNTEKGKEAASDMEQYLKAIKDDKVRGKTMNIKNRLVGRIDALQQEATTLEVTAEEAEEFETYIQGRATAEQWSPCYSSDRRLRLVDVILVNTEGEPHLRVTKAPAMTDLQSLSKDLTAAHERCRVLEESRDAMGAEVLRLVQAVEQLKILSRTTEDTKQTTRIRAW